MLDCIQKVEENMSNTIELNRTYHQEIPNFSFGPLDEEELIEIYTDGRAASFFLERCLAKWFPELTHIKGCKGWDHVDETGQKYDAKNFTFKGGLKFMPSGMIGTGRKYDAVECRAKIKENNLIYIMCDIVDFPKIRVKFRDGLELFDEYPKGKITKKNRELVFG